MKNTTCWSATTLTIPLLALSGIVSAGDFDGVTLDAKLIGGQQYEALYARIAEWETETGAKLNVISKKNHFELDKEFKSDMAAGSLGWCVGSNHSSFASQYPTLYTDLTPYLTPEFIAEYVDSNIAASIIGDQLVMLPRAQFDVSALCYQKSPYADADRQKEFKEKYGYDLTPPDTWQQVTDQAVFFSDPPNFYGTQFAGKDEAIVGRFYEMVVAEGGALSNLDAKLRAQMRVEIKKLHQRIKTTIVYVTHDQVEAMTLADRIVIMRDGYIEQQGTSLEVFETPVNTFVATFIGSPPMNLLEATVSEYAGSIVLSDGTALPVPHRLAGKVSANQAIVFGFRADNLMPEGHGLTLSGETASFDLLINLSPALNPRPVKMGETLRCQLDMNRSHLFDAVTQRSLG